MAPRESLSIHLSVFPLATSIVRYRTYSRAPHTNVEIHTQRDVVRVLRNAPVSIGGFNGERKSGGFFWPAVFLRRFLFFPPPLSIFRRPTGRPIIRPSVHTSVGLFGGGFCSAWWPESRDSAFDARTLSLFLSARSESTSRHVSQLNGPGGNNLPCVKYLLRHPFLLSSSYVSTLFFHFLLFIS